MTTPIVRAAIHPAIGIARVGNSSTEWYLAPEVVSPPDEAPHFYRDADGALKRQGVRFRIYGYDSDGKVVSELTSDDAEIEWSVHVANCKAAWYQFQLAMDIPEVVDADKTKLRNLGVADRSELVIDPGPRTISGRNVNGAEYQLNTGKFFNLPIDLGEVRTDDVGRLIFLGGFGKSASKDDQAPQDFANNDGWYDDTSDGPVDAVVRIGGQTIPVEGAWVVTAPPNYAPGLKSTRTMYDLMRDVFVADGRMERPATVSFTRDILPILNRLRDLQWVNKGFADAFGHDGVFDFNKVETLRKLSQLPAAGGVDRYAEHRRQIYAAFRQFDRDAWSPVPWPFVYGDAMNVPPQETPREYIELAQVQLNALLDWGVGKFTDDFDSNATPPQSLDDIPLAEQPATLDEAALSECVADAFHPGCELTWPMRHSSLYSAPFRIRRRTQSSEPDFGDELTPEEALSTNGPLYGQAPGTLTRWMAIPWQTDAASCRSGYASLFGHGAKYDPYLPTFWPARVPNHVLTAAEYETAIDTSLSDDERADAFSQRASWFAHLGNNYREGLKIMVREFHLMGVVVAREGLDDDPTIPARLRVADRPETGPPSGPTAPVAGLVPVDHGVDVPPGTAEALAGRAARRFGLNREQVMTGSIDKVRRFPQGLTGR